MDKSHILNLIGNHRAFFSTGRTKDLSFRIDQLKILRQAIISNESAIFDALKKDLNKPAYEAYGGDTAVVINEIDYVLKHLWSWAKPKRVRTPLAYFPSRSFVLPEPYGVALIIGPWNFPFQLLLGPLVGAIAAGNCVLLKPPIAVPHSTRLIAKLVHGNFDPDYISLVEGGAETGQMLLEEQFDYIFFTGGAATGRLVMQAAAKHLTPVTLELGGKNPCIVDVDTHLEYTARRIVWGKFFNAGQSCVAVDHLLVDKRIKQRLLDLIVKNLIEFYGADPAQSPDYGRIVNNAHFERLSRLLGQGTIIAGGQSDRAMRYIAPTIIDNIKGQEPIMEDEIFGPLLPVIDYDDLTEAIAMVNSRPKPLALYFFSRDKKKQELVLSQTSSGGGCINDTTIHETARLPFGGVGESGTGKYHGKASFDTFSHDRSIVKSGFLFDVALRYPPYKDHLKWLRRFF
ncbi:MAG TPA: aldehyde dehydrogenase [Nitrospirota bacterium]|nr:aldehyde dehydrogenase [Nitrospirota bacterium]